jgi:hypothetical protein
MPVRALKKEEGRDDGDPQQIPPCRFGLIWSESITAEAGLEKMQTQFFLSGPLRLMRVDAIPRCYTAVLILALAAASAADVRARAHPCGPGLRST